MIPIVSIVGKSDSGKTTLLEKLIPELKARGVVVATVKHDVHGFDIDVPGKDTWRHARAGADIVFISNSEKTAMISRAKRGLSLDEIAEMAEGADILITEGFKRADKPKIEVSRAQRSNELICAPDELVAVASDQRFDIDVPQFDLADAAGLAGFIYSRFVAGHARTGDPEPVANGDAAEDDLAGTPRSRDRLRATGHTSADRAHGDGEPGARRTLGEGSEPAGEMRVAGQVEDERGEPRSGKAPHG